MKMLDWNDAEKGNSIIIKVRAFDRRSHVPFATFSINGMLGLEKIDSGFIIEK